MKKSEIKNDMIFIQHLTTGDIYFYIAYKGDECCWGNWWGVKIKNPKIYDSEALAFSKVCKLKEIEMPTGIEEIVGKIRRITIRNLLSGWI